MSGCGRKHRAKHLTRQYLDDHGWLGPKDNQDLVVSLESPHGKHLRVLKVVCRSEDGNSVGASTTGSTDPCIVSLPGKFSKVIWIAKFDVLVVEDGAVHVKPSPSQIENFFAEHPEWQVAVERTVATAKAISGVSAPLQDCVAVDVTGEDPTSELDNLENPNRGNIRHRQAFFIEDEERRSVDEEDESATDADEEPGDDVDA